MRPDACPYRDVWIALPARERCDVYREHQAVWRALVDLGMPAVDRQVAPFLFASDGESLIEARLPHRSLRAPLSAVALSGQFRCRVLAVERSDSMQRAVRRNAIVPFVTHLFAGHGLAVRDVEVLDRRTRQGWKGDVMEIDLPTVEVGFVGQFQSALHAQKAWTRGIGRAKRFGCGMLRVA